MVKRSRTGGLTPPAVPEASEKSKIKEENLNLEELDAVSSDEEGWESGSAGSIEEIVGSEISESDDTNEPSSDENDENDEKDDQSDEVDSDLDGIIDSGEDSENGGEFFNPKEFKKLAKITKGLAVKGKMDEGGNGGEENEGEGNFQGGAEAINAGKEQEEEDLNPDPGSDSSEDEKPNRNTVGNVPLVWYKHEDHIGYDNSGTKIDKKSRKDRLDALLEKMDNDGLVTSIYDDYNDEDVPISREELKMLLKIRKGQFPHVEMDPFEEFPDWFTSKRRIHPLNNAPKPKSSFVPSKHEEKKVLEMVRAIRKGWLKLDGQRKEAPKTYLMWEDDNKTVDKTAAGLSYIPAPKRILPGHEQSYNPPKEYLPSKEEKEAVEDENEANKESELPKFIPKGYEALRKVPAYERYINEVFERCLDLYLCPRIRNKRPKERTDPDSLIPQLPKPKDLQPFPMTMYIQYIGHTGKVRSVQPDPTGQWLASGSDDGCVRLWETRTGRCLHSWQLNSPVLCVAWCPKSNLKIISAAVGKRIVLLPAQVGDIESRDLAKKALKLPNVEFRDEGKSCANWVERGGENEGLEIQHAHLVKKVAWHFEGDYFASVAPEGHSKAVIVHRLSRRASQNPFRKNKGRVVQVMFHPSKPILFVQSENHVRVYNLANQSLMKKLSGSRAVMTCMAVHPGGDNLIVGGDDRRLVWYDLDLSRRPYKALRFHKQPIRGIDFHRAYPLFASASDDGTVQVFHGMVYNDLLTNALIVPVKILRGHEIVDLSGVLDCAFHPSQPWVFTAGADGVVNLYCN